MTALVCNFATHCMKRLFAGHISAILMSLLLWIFSPPSLAEVKAGSDYLQEFTLEKADAFFKPEIEVEAGLTYENVSKGRDPWRRNYVEGMYLYGVRKVLYGIVQQTDRFNVGDEELLGGLYYPLRSNITGVFEISYSPSHRALADKSIFAQLEIALQDGWGLHLGHRFRNYPDTKVNISNITVERYFGDYRGAYTLSKSALSQTGLRTSYRLQLSRYYGDRSSIGVVLAQGQEAEYVTSTQSTTDFDVRAFTIVGRHWLNNDWAISYVFNIHEQGDSYTRRGVTFGIRRKF